MTYLIDKRLEEDSLPVGKLALCEVRLLNDSRWPWILLIPMIDNRAEIFDLEMSDQAMLAEETTRTSIAVKSITGAEKINSAAIGNIVRQLHVHVIARNEGDANWPGPVWGHGEKIPYSGLAASQFISRLQSELKLHVL